MEILSKTIRFVKEHSDDAVLAVGVVLISLFSFALGYISANQQNNAPLIFEETTDGK